MFKSIKTKIIMTVMALFLVGISVMTAISSTQVKNRTEDNVVNSSGALINEMGFAIENYLGQYENGLAQLSTSNSITNFVLDDSAEPKSLLETVNQELSTFLELYSDAISVYYSNPDHHINMPYSNLGPDYDP